LSETGRPGRTGSPFLILVLWLCAAGAVWLLASPAGFKRRALTRHAKRLERELREERRYTEGLERWRDGLATDPSVIEREARKMGYGVPGERSLPLISEQAVRDAGTMSARGVADTAPRGRAWRSTIRQSVAPVVMVIIGVAVAALFFKGLRVDDPAEQFDAPSGESEERG